MVAGKFVVAIFLSSLLARIILSSFWKAWQRDRDLEDMAILARHGLDYEAILDECIDQSNLNQRGNNWEAFLELKCKELNEKHGIVVPFL